MILGEQNSMKIQEKRNEIIHISVLQIIGPILVILGHSLNGNNIVMTDTFNKAAGLGKYWYMFSKHWIYLFHMPLFFMISGYLLSYKNYLNGKNYGSFVVQKFWRLVFPYLVWNIVFYVPKVYFQNLTNDIMEISVAGIIKSFFFPMQNIWGHTWFLVALFVLYLATPIWERVCAGKKGKITMFVIGMILYFVPINTGFLCFDSLRRYFIVFILGCILGSIPIGDLKSYAKKYELIYYFVAIILSVVFTMWYYKLENFKVFPAIFILLSLIFISLKVNGLSEKMVDLSKRNFGIYIMHWPIMIVVRTVCITLNIHIVLTIILTTICGFIGPNIVISVLRKTGLGKVRVIKLLLGV